MTPLLWLRRDRRSLRRLPRFGNALLALVLTAGIGLVVPAGAQQQTGATYGPVRPADTLWELALRFRGETNVTAQQAMIALLRANPEAFREGNINALRTGVTLRVPTAQEMNAITQNEAVAEFNRHEQAWRNRRRTGTAAPGPGPASTAPAQPAPAPAAPSDGPSELEAELGAVRAEVTELNKRLAERDDAIEELLVQLAAVRRELRQAQGDAPAAPPPASDAGGEPASDGAARATWLPVSPLVLGSSLIVLLVLIVVVTLIRQRGEREEPYTEDDGEEDPYELEPDERDDEAFDDDPDRGWGDDGDDSEPSRTATARPSPVSAAVAADVAAGFDADREDEDPAEDDLPIGMDLEGEEDWDSDPEKGAGDRPVTAQADGPPGYGRHLEVGELDDLDLEAGPARSSFANVPEDLEGDDPPEDGAPGRSGGGRRE